MRRPRENDIQKHNGRGRTGRERQGRPGRNSRRENHTDTQTGTKEGALIFGNAGKIRTLEQNKELLFLVTLEK